MELWKNINDGKPESSEEIKDIRLKILLEILNEYNFMRDKIMEIIDMGYDITDDDHNIINSGYNLAGILYTLYQYDINNNPKLATSNPKSWELYQKYVWYFLGLYVGKGDNGIIYGNYGLSNGLNDLITFIPENVGNNYNSPDIMINYSEFHEKLQEHLNGKAR